VQSEILGRVKGALPSYEEARHLRSRPWWTNLHTKVDGRLADLAPGTVLVPTRPVANSNGGLPKEVDCFLLYGAAYGRLMLPKPVSHNLGPVDVDLLLADSKWLAVGTVPTTTVPTTNMVGMDEGKRGVAENVDEPAHARVKQLLTNRRVDEWFLGIALSADGRWRHHSWGVSVHKPTAPNVGPAPKTTKTAPTAAVDECTRRTIVETVEPKAAYIGLGLAELRELFPNMAALVDSH
jgi:hypothetical protein